MKSFFCNHKKRLFEHRLVNRLGYATNIGGLLKYYQLHIGFVEQFECCREASRASTNYNSCLLIQNFSSLLKTFNVIVLNWLRLD